MVRQFLITMIQFFYTSSDIYQVLATLILVVPYRVKKKKDMILGQLRLISIYGRVDPQQSGVEYIICL